MSASNATPAETEVLHSSRSAARYSVAEDRWERLPDLPAGRSSHDAVVAGGVLYVVGGWELRGPDEDAVWADTVLALALDRATEWRAIAAPFERRALAAGAAGGRIYALGGLTPDAGPQLRVDALDTASGEWVRGPDLPPAGSLQGFGVAAASHSDRVLASQADGKVYRLTEDAGSWELAATLATPRFMHRIIPSETGCSVSAAHPAPGTSPRSTSRPCARRRGIPRCPSRVRSAGRAFWAAGTPTSAGLPGCR